MTIENCGGDKGQKVLTVKDVGGPGLLAGLGVPGQLGARGGDQAVVGQLLHPQVPGGAAVDAVVPRRHALVVLLARPVRREDERLRGGREAWVGGGGEGARSVSSLGTRARF